MNKKHLYTAVTILAVYAAVAAVQKMWPIPVIGAYLPKASA
jgi:hypothetical protein